MSEVDPHALDDMYRTAKETARELVTLIKLSDGAPGVDEDGNMIRGQVRQAMRQNTDVGNWLLVEVLARSVAATYEDLADWSDSVIKAVSDEQGDQP